ncbi:MAG: tRNA lysidine(34) synthetase TilS, partial [Actinobacteria bacterium]
MGGPGPGVLAAAMASAPSRGAARSLARPPAVRRVLQKIAGSARTHRMFERGGTVVAAVSGGPDSLCLLHSLVRLRRLLDVEPVCFHFDHRLRPGSERDAAYVRGQAEGLGVPIVVRTADSKPRRGESVEAWARVARYEALRDVAEEVGAVAAVAHTADDQAETVLLAILRGSGLGAVAAMKPVSRPIVRPMLEVTREETTAFCRAIRLRPRRDPMNVDPAFMRVALRRRVIPALEEALGRGVRDALVRTAALLRADAEFLEELAAAAEPEVVERDGDDSMLRVEALRDLSPAIAGRVVRHALLSHRVVPEAAHIEAVLGLATSRPGASVSLPAALK